MKRYKCDNCGQYISLLVDAEVAVCPLCDGKLVPCPVNTPAYAPTTLSCKIQYLVFEDGTEELMVSGTRDSRAFAYKPDRDGTWDWQPMGLVDVFRPYSRFKDSVGRIF